MMNNNENFLNNKFSLSNQIWLKPRKDIQELATNFQQVYQISYPLAIFLAQKGLEIDQIENFLNPRIKFSMTDPSLLLDMNNAITIITNSIINNKRIAIFADYDVDGGASAALLYKWFENFKIKPTIYIPDRDKEGYGPNIEAMTKLSLDHDLIICVDCGTISDYPITKAKKNNCHVIVVDHHQGGDKNTKADALVNPNRVDEKSELKFLCAAGVTFLLLVALNRELKKFEFNVPDILPYLDLVALATVSDVVPLIKLNRAFVRSGLKIIEMGKNVGIKSLIEISKISKPINTNHIGFNIGPKINAGGRLGSPKLGVELLIEKNQDEAIKIAKTLESLNENRKFLENVMIDKAASLLKKDQLKNEFIWVADKEFKPGITGIIASRLLEKYNKTSLVISIDKNGIGKGSGRSNSNHNLGNAISQLSEEKLITKGGGHAKAAGITIEEKKLRIAMNRLNEILSIQQKNNCDDLTFKINSIISINAITLDLIEEIDKAGPFGPDSPKPIFVVKNCKIKWCKLLGNKHLRFYIYDNSFRKIQSIFFRALENKAGTFLYENLEGTFHFAGNLEINDWLGKKEPNFVVKDIAIANS